MSPDKQALIDLPIGKVIKFTYYNHYYYIKINKYQFRQIGYSEGPFDSLIRPYLGDIQSIDFFLERKTSAVYIPVTTIKIKESIYEK